jgi:hypothetical protein
MHLRLRHPRRGIFPNPTLFAAILAGLLWIGVPAQTVQGDTALELSLELTTGPRLAGLRWNIARDLYGTSPNILSELTWSDLQVFQVQRDAEIIFNDVVFRMSVGYGWITAGDSQDSDYNFDDRTDEWSRSYSDSRGGFLFSGSAALGYRFRLGDGFLILKPLLGFAYNQQAMVMTDGVQVILPPTGPVAGLNSSYVAHWGSMWTGAAIDAGIAEGLSLGVELAFHGAAYIALADWNLRPDLAHPVSFVHRAVGLGAEGKISLDFRINQWWTLRCSFGAEYWEAGPGLDITYRNDGSYVVTRLNEVVWRSLSVAIGPALHY